MNIDFNEAAAPNTDPHQGALSLPDPAQAPAPDPAQAARYGFFAASETDPQTYAEISRLAKIANVPVDAAMANPKEVKQQVRMGSIDFNALAQTSPATAAVLANIDSAKLAHDDVNNMSDVETALTYMGASGKAGGHDFLAATAKLIDTVQPFTTSDQDLATLYKNDPEGLKRQREQGATAILSRFARNQTAQANEIMQGIPQQAKDAYGDLKYATTDTDNAAYLSPVKMISDSIRSLPTTAALALTTFLTRGAANTARQRAALAEGATEETIRQAGIDAATEMATQFGAASEGVVGYGQQANQTQQTLEDTPTSNIDFNHKARDVKPGDLTLGTWSSNQEFQDLISQGYDPDAAKIYLSARGAEQSGAMAGVVDTLTNAVGGHFLGKIIGDGGKVLPRIGKGLANEGAVETVQSGGEQLGENAVLQSTVKPDTPLLDNVFESMIQGGVVGGLTGGTFAGIMGGARKRKDQAGQAEQNAQMIEQLNKLSQASQVLARSPETFENLVQQASANGTVNQVYIEANALMQTGLADQLAALSPSVAAQIQVAVQTGGQIAIPIEEYTTQIAPTELAQPLLDHLKLDPEGYSRAEATAYMQTEGDQLRADMENTLSVKLQDLAFRQSRDGLKTQFKTQLDALNHHASHVNEAYATHLANYFGVMSERMGMTPEEMYQQFPVNFASELTPGQHYDQNVTPQVMKQLEADNRTTLPKIPTGKVFNNPIGTIPPELQTLADAALDATLNAPSLSINVADIVPTQKNLTTGNIKSVKGATDAPYLIKHGDKYFVVDGHHRVARALLNGSDTVQAKVFSTEPLVYHQKEPAEGANAITGDLERVNPDVREAVESRIARMDEAEQQRVRANLEEHKSTAWAAAAIKGMAYREMLERALVGEDISNLERNAIWGKQDMSATKLIKTFKKHPEAGPRVLKHLLSSYDFIGGNRKAENDVSTSFTNCDPSEACAIHCYAANSNARPSELAKSEFTEFMIEHFPEEMADRLVSSYMATSAGKSGLSLRLNDKGDLSQAQVRLIELMNEKGVATQVFSKRPELLRSLSDMNLKMLSVDGSNMALAEANPDLRLAVTITDETTEAMLIPLHDRVSVYLPVNLKGKAVTKEELKSRFPTLYRRMLRENLCPVDGGKLETKPGTSFVDILDKTADKGVWTCTACDLTGVPGCFKGDRQTNQRKAQTISLTEVTKELRAAKVRKELQKNLEELLNLGGIDGELYSQLSQALSTGQRAVREIANAGTESGSSESTSGTAQTTEGSGSGTGSDTSGTYNQSKRSGSDPWTADLFGDSLPSETGKDGSTPAGQPGKTSLFRNDAPAGNYATKTELVKENTRDLGTKKVKTIADAAQALAYLSRSAVERFDALITDKNGKPLAIVGAFKGAQAQASVFPSTIAGEAFRINGAAHIYFAHNHPSGNPTLSAADRNLNSVLSEVFRGSEITPHGLFAIGGAHGTGRRWMHENSPDDMGNKYDSLGETSAPDKSVKVPVVERVLSEEGKLGPALNSPQMAKNMAEDIADGKSGVMLLNNQNQPTGFVELKEDDIKTLRKGGKMDALYRAISVSNVGAAIFVNNGALSDMGITNAAGLFNSLDIPVLDVISFAKEGGAVSSWAEIGKSFNNKSFNQGTEVNRGSFNPESLTISLFKDANLSTILHETGHFFLEAHFHLASQLERMAEDLGIDALSTGQKSILADAQIILDWFGIPDLATWYSLDLEQKRPFHEQFARGSESYLYEGKAPSLELAPLFQRFSQWLRRVYESVKALNVEINDELRGVFDRMLASEAEIAQAQKARSMMPLFASQETSPMSPEEFAIYQESLIRATDASQDDLQSRLLRDMQWLRNARAKAMKGLQKDAKKKRREERMEVKRQVMSQPVYRAWALLTGKITDDNKIPSPQNTKSNPNSVEPDKDSLFAAIAKLGGLNKAELQSTWDLDPAYKPYSGVFGKPVWRKDGGLSIDGMVEALVAHGYLPADAHGKADIRDLEDAFDAELRGNKQYSFEYDHNRNAERKAGEQVVNPHALTAVRLDLGELLAAGYHDDLLDVLKARKMTTSKDGFDPEIVANLVLDDQGQPEFHSGDELLRALVAARPPNEVIEDQTDARMLEKYGDIATPQALEKAADVAVHNEYRAHVVATEANALAKITKNPRILVSAAKALAAEIVERKKVRHATPGQFTQAEARAAKSADKYFKDGDFINAEAEKKNQLFNLYAAKAVMDAQAEIAKIDKFFKKVVGGKDVELAKLRDMDVVNAARAVLGKFGYGGKAKGAMEYLKSVEKYDPQAYLVLSQSVQFAEALAASAKFQKGPSIKDLTIEQLRELSEEIATLWHLAKRNKEMEIDGKMFNRELIADELRLRMDEIGVPDVMPGDLSAVTPGEERLMRFASLKAVLRRVESWVDLKDGFNKMGPFRRYLWTPVREAADRYRADKISYLKELRAAFATIAPTFKTTNLHSPELNYTFGKDSGGVAMNELLHAILHTGNDSNKRKLLLGRKWADQRADGSVDTAKWDAFVTRMIHEGVLTQAHFDFAQTIWDLLDKTKPLAQKAHRDAFGRYFTEVTANEFTTPWGSYRGGYIPASVDSRIVKDMALKKLVEEGNDSMSHAFPSASKGFTMARVDYNRPLMLDLRTLPQHLDKVLMFSHLEMPVRDATKLLNTGAVKSGLNRQDPAAINDMLIPWLNRTAHQQVTTPISGMPWLTRFLNTLRNRTSMAAMFANVSNTAQQITGFSLAAVKVSPTRLLSATADYMKAPKAFTAEVADMSLYMAHRMENEVGAMLDDIDKILLNPTLFENAQAWTKQHQFFMQSAVDNVMGPIIWKGAFDQALEENYDEKAAVRIADAVVRQTQGSSQAEDVSRMETGPAYARIFTLFAGYFNMQANLLGSEFGKVSQEMGLRKNTGKGFMIFVLSFYVPALVAQAIAEGFRGGPGDDDKDGEYLDDWLMSLFVYGPLRNATAFTPFVGQMVNSAVARFNNNPNDDRVSLSPVVSALENAGGAVKDLIDIANGEGNAKQTVRDVATLISLTVGLPASVAARPIGYMAGVAQDKIAPIGPVDLARGLITGAPSPESRQH